jgi:hypothetical protein
MRLRAAGNGAAGATPWRFDSAPIEITAAARLVPARRYSNAAALFAAGQPYTLRWQWQGVPPS